MNKKIGVVTGGGDCPGLNTVIRAVAKAAAQRGWETIGIIGGYQGLLHREFPGAGPQRDRWPFGPRRHDLGDRQPRSVFREGRARVDRRLPVELLDDTKRGMDALGLHGLVTIGGDGSLSIAQQFHEHGIPIIGVPKTIDNDLEGTLMTFGFDSAVACATDAARPVAYDGGESQPRDGVGSHGTLRRLELRSTPGWPAERM